MNNVDNFFSELRPILTVVEEMLEKTFEDVNAKTLQIPDLLGVMSLQLNWDDEQFRRNDPIVRAYLRSHPTWYVSRGAKGGIMRRSEYQKREAAKVAKELAKDEIRAVLNAKTTPVVASETDESTST